MHLYLRGSILLLGLLAGSVLPSRAAGPIYVDLAPVVNTAREDDGVANNGQGGWSDEGINDMGIFPPIPVGEVERNGQKFRLLDPAAHGGHRLTDLAMLALFGTPYLDRIHDAYAEASEWLPDGWRELIGLHQLHPLLVHAELFGGGYRHRAVAIAGRYS